MKQELKNSYSKITLIKNSGEGFGEEGILIYNLTPDNEEDYEKEIFRTIVSVKNESSLNIHSGILEIVIFT